MKEIVIEETQEKIRKAIDHVRDEFSTVRTGRATPALVEKLPVEYYGSTQPLQSLAGFNVPEPRVLVIKPYDTSALAAIEKAIQGSDLGVNPSNDGALIRITFPQLTEERRKELVKVVKARAEDGRVAVRNLRRSARHDLEELEKAGELGRDELERVEKDLEKQIQAAVAEIDSLVTHKEQELLEV